LSQFSSDVTDDATRMHEFIGYGCIILRWSISESFCTLQVSRLIIVVLLYLVNEQLHAVGAAPYTSASH
jgi:hypothetical protein